MSFFHVDQRPVRARCEEILARVPPPADPDHEIRVDVARAELRQLLEKCVLVPGATADGVAWLLIESHRTRDPDATRRTIARAIPIRGAVPQRRGLLGLLGLVAVLGLLVWFLGWLGAGAALLVAWILDSLVRQRVSAHGRAIRHVVRMQRAARAAEEAGDVAAVNALYAEARAMIAEDRVPARAGYCVAHVLDAAVMATPFPTVLLRELRLLLFVAPEAEYSYWQVREAIEHGLKLRVSRLASRIRRSLRRGDACGPLRAELRELARRASGATDARLRQAEILREVVREALDSDDGADLDSILDEIAELVERLASFERGVPPHDFSRVELGTVLDDIVSHSTAPAVVQRARELRTSVEALRSRRGQRRPAARRARPPAPSRLHRIVTALRRPSLSRTIAQLQVVAAATTSHDDGGPRVRALYGQVRDAAVRRPGGRRDEHLVTAMRLAATWASERGDAALLGEVRDDARSLIALGRVPAGSGTALAGVLRDCVQAGAFPMKLLDDYAALRGLAEDAVPWSIVDAAILGVEARLDAISRSGGAGSYAALVEIAAAFETTVARASDPGIAERAHKLAAYAAKGVERLAPVHEASQQRRARRASVIDDLVRRLELESSSTAPSSPPQPTPRRSGRSTRPIVALHAAVAAIAATEETRPRVLALYRQVRDAAAKGHERRQREFVTAMRLAATWASKHGDAALMSEIRDAVRELLARRWIPVGTGAELAGVLRECVGADPFPTTLLDDYAALRALAPDVGAPHFWSIVDAAILRVEVRLGEVAKSGGGAALREIAAAFEATAARASDPEIARRARELAALSAPSPSP